MFFRFDLGFDADAWSSLQAQASAHVERLGEALASRGWMLYLLWANRGELTGFVVASAPVTDADADEAAPVVADAVGAQVTEIAAIEVELPTDRPILDAERWQLVTTAAVGGPDKTCEKCGGVPPDHLEDCGLRRVHRPVPAEVATPSR
jgi:hypothetical protein